MTATAISLRTKLLAALLGVGLVAVLATGWQASRRAEASLRQAAISQLTSIRAERARQIEAYFAAVRRDVGWLSESREIADAMRDLGKASRDLESLVTSWSDGRRSRLQAGIERFYASAFLPRLRELEPAADADPAQRFVPRDDVAVALQSLFIVDVPDGDRERIDRPEAGGAYGDAHARRHPLLRSIARRFGYGDLFLIDPDDGRVVYTVAKRTDFGTDLLTGPYRNTRLSRVFRAARATTEAGAVKLIDFESYPAALGAPTAFAAASILEGEHRLGVIVLEIPIDGIDAVMTGERRWEGLGRTGETYLVGPDRRMRSDSRFFLESPPSYLEAVAATGVPDEVAALMRTHGRTVLFQQITGAAAHAALGGRTGTATERDYREQPVLTSYAPVGIPELRWGIVAQVDEAEAFAPAIALRRSLLATAGALAIVVIVLAVLLARSLTAPIRRLIAAMGTLGRGNLAQRLPERRRDEIGQITTAFNRMASDLQETTVTRDHVNSILESMSDAVIVVRPPAGAPDWRDAVVVTVNPAACAMLGRPAAAIVGERIGSVVSAITAGPEPQATTAGLWLEDVLRDGRIGAREVVYKVRDGREIPVLFSSAVIGGGSTAVGGIVCAAHDLTELKATEARSAFIRDTFGRYVSDEVVATLLGSPEALRLGGELRRITVMMSDLRGFTLLAARLTPEAAITFLNGYLQTMVDLILEHRGTINEIMGDGILVIFGAPTALPDDAERAVRCAVAMQRAMPGVNARIREQGVPEIEMGIGIHTGEAIVGNIGSDRRMKYAAVGTTVNLAGRIESFTTGGQILVSDATRVEAGDAVKVSGSLTVQAKGATEPLTVWEVSGVGDDAVVADATAPALVALATPLPIRYAVLDQKVVGAHVLEGRFVRLSERGGEIQAAEPVPPMTNVKIWMDDPAIDGGDGELYAKVVEDLPVSVPGFVVRFTAMTPAVSRRLRHRMA
jgi:PAS domain S-box-containing protein